MQSALLDGDIWRLAEIWLKGVGMKRYLCLVLCGLVLILGGCSSINREPDPTLRSINSRLDQDVGSRFGPDATIMLTKNCFSLHEPVPIHLTLQAGTRDLPIGRSHLFVEGPFQADSSVNLSRSNWVPDGFPPVIKVGEPMIQTTWTVTPTMEGIYHLRWEDEQGFRSPLSVGFGVGYIVNNNTLKKFHVRNSKQNNDSRSS